MPAKPIRTRDQYSRREGELIKPGEIVAVEGVESWTLAETADLEPAAGQRLVGPPRGSGGGVHHSARRVARQSRQQRSAPRDSLRQASDHPGVSPSPKRQDAHRSRCSVVPTSTTTTGRSGQLAYEFHRKKLVPLLRDSEIYARMEVKVLSAFTSKYSLQPLRGPSGAGQLAQDGGDARPRHAPPVARRSPAARWSAGQTSGAYARGAGRARGERLLADQRSRPIWSDRNAGRSPR